MNKKIIRIILTFLPAAVFAVSVGMMVSNQLQYRKRLQTLTRRHGSWVCIPAAGEGICLDYASLMAAMLRSQGVPMIFCTLCLAIFSVLTQATAERKPINQYIKERYT